MLKSLNEWASENNYQLDTFGHTQPNDMSVLYDEDLVTQQVNNWLNKLAGLCSPIPKADRPELVEQIIKAIRRQLLN